MEIMHTDIRVYEVKDKTIWVVCNFPRMKSDIKKKNHRELCQKMAGGGRGGVGITFDRIV